MKDLDRAYSPSKGETVEGWIFDLYPSNSSEMTVWIKTETGECLRLVDKWSPFLYVSTTNQADLKSLIPYLPKNSVDVKYEIVEKFIGLRDVKRTKILKLTAPDIFSLKSLAKLIWRLGDFDKYRLWNVDIPLSQMYLYNKDLFPLAYVQATATTKGVAYNLIDAAEEVEYPVPSLKIAELDLKIEHAGTAPSFEDPIEEISLSSEDELMVIDSSNEGEMILRLVKDIREMDPDIILTHGGDSFLFTYLARRAAANDVLSDLILGRDGGNINLTRKEGTSYFSYGRVYYRDAPQRFLGRLHIDIENSGTYAHYGLAGLIEVARTCRIPLCRTSRVSIGSCMTAIQLYQAVKDDVLIPWKKSEPENLKDAKDLILADRGGFYFEPQVGIHDNVGEIDFSSMYPMLMFKKNISPETIGCECCPDSTSRVPELDYSICQRRTGIVPKVLELMLRKRMYYKEMRNKARNPQERMKYEQRQAAYKIILCTCFGYLGYRNARFGKIDAHIAACAFARKTLLDTTRLVEERGFHIIHGIVDSLYIKKEEATDREFIELCKTITEKTGLPISYEGRYRWIVFVPSKIHFGVPVLNRFYGVFQNGELKIRGIELRRGDTPNIITQFQCEVIQELAKAKSSEEFHQRIPCVLSIFKKYVDRIINHEVNLEDLLINKQLSKDPERYVKNSHQTTTARQLQRQGVEIRAGQTVKYIIKDAVNKRPERRVIALQLLGAETHYDITEYVRLLSEALHTILSPSRLTKEEQLTAYS